MGEPVHGEGLPEEVATRLDRLLKDLRFGTVTLVVQDGRVIQIDRNEKIRIR
ncbi:MAG TPA: YezD family protein [Verrucomicrobiae bacterium]|nr:YezD family protein [Verrucomicrobiae bacterium]